MVARMAKVKRKIRVRAEFVQAMDATPERLAKGDHSEMVNPAEIDDTEQAIARVRRFRSSHLDRLHTNGRLSWRQFRSAERRVGKEGVSTGSSWWWTAT